MIAAAFTKRESILLLIVFLLGLFLILRTLETAKVCRRIEMLRKSHGSAPLKADSFLFDPKLLDELNAMIDYLNRERSRLYHREEDVKAMVTGISHDFRTPLTSISGYVQVLREEGPELPEEERRRYQNIIESRADSLAALAEDFYTFSSLDSLDLTARPVKCNPLTALRSVLAQYYLDLERHFPELKLDIPELTLSAEIDRVFFERVITNLLRNALSYGEDFFRLRAESEKDVLRISFTNGLPDNAALNQENIEAIFDRKFSVNLSGGSASSGLGLFIARRLMEEQNGRIEASCDEDTLSLICILPLCKEETKEDPELM